MPAKVIDGRKIAADVRAKVKRAIDEEGLALKIGSILVGDNDASRVYIRQKAKACKKVGIDLQVHEVPEDATTDLLLAAIKSRISEFGTTGVIIELPLPDHIAQAKIAQAIPPLMDLDGLNPINYGKLLHGEPCLAPSTPLAVMEIIRREGIKIEGADVTVVNHSAIIGKPLALMLLKENASLKVAHVFTKDLKHYTKDAEVLVTAAGVPELIKADMVKEGALVIDVSMNRVGGKLCGDVAFDEVAEKAASITPVPGGVGPVTVAMLISNTLKAHKFQGEQEG
jgi:methylenetetrahydrofolate dehydrogenase (NADP+)/methenyltetrahydrofolate cyclohydrolase